MMIDKLSDPDMYMFFEKGIRGGISTVCTKRYVKATNPYPKSYDHTKPLN